MSAKRLNVLVYAGPGTTPGSVNHCLYSLRRLLTPNYAVLTCQSHTIIKEPWESTCALLVLPGGADLSYCESLNGPGNQRIRKFVEDGGSYLGLCAGGYYGSARCEFEVGNAGMEVIGPRELAFYPGACRGSVFPGFVYNSEEGAVAAHLIIDEDAFALPNARVPRTVQIYLNGGGIFVDAEKYQDTEGFQVLATYAQSIIPASSAELASSTSDCTTSSNPSGRTGPAAIIYRNIGHGKVILSGPHPEFAVVNLDREAKGMREDVFATLKEHEPARAILFRALLMKFGLTINESEIEPPALTPIHLWSQESILSQTIQAWSEAAVTVNGKAYIKGEEDIFHVHDGTNGKLDVTDERPLNSIRQILHSNSVEEKDLSWMKFLESNALVKDIYCHNRPQLASPTTNPFDASRFFLTLDSYGSSTHNHAHKFGQTLMYGRVVTSTSTTLEKNSILTSNLPQGATFLATTQVSGRGRGSNVWISAPGSLLFSTILRHPLTSNLNAPIVFLQYLAALAIVEGIQTYDVFDHDPMWELKVESPIITRAAHPPQETSPYRKLPIRLKWPNDIYALDPSKPSAQGIDGPASYVKIGGILVNTSYANGEYTVIIGIGLNMANTAPTTSLNALVDAANASAASGSPLLAHFDSEQLLARILSTFESFYDHFLANGFRGELERCYYKHWLHTDQVVTLEEEGHSRARIKGITMDWGMLVAEEEEEPWQPGRAAGMGKTFMLQSNSNSFDFFKGLVKRKL